MVVEGGKGEDPSSREKVKYFRQLGGPDLVSGTFSFRLTSNTVRILTLYSATLLLASTPARQLVRRIQVPSSSFIAAKSASQMPKGAGTRPDASVPFSKPLSPRPTRLRPLLISALDSAC